MAEQRRTTDLVGAVPRDRKVEVRDHEEGLPEIPGVRESDLEPYVGLRYLSRLFRLIAVILLLLLVADEELSYDEIAELTEQSTGAVRPPAN